MERECAGNNLSLEFQLKFRELVLDIAKGFIRLPHGQNFQHIRFCIESIGRFFEVDRTFFCGMDKGCPQISKIKEWCRQGVQPSWSYPDSISPQLIKWWAAQSKNSDIILIDDVEQLRSNEKARKILLKKNTKSMITLVLRLQRKIIGIIGLETVREKKKWPREYIPLIQMIKDIFLSAFEKNEWEKIMAQQHHLLSTTLNSVKDGVISVNNKTGRIEMFNKAAEEITQYRREEALDRKWTDILQLYNAEGKQFTATLDEYFLSPGSENHNDYYKLKVRDGGTKFVSFDLSPARFRKNAMGTVLVIKDVTDSKKAEEEILSLSYCDKLTGLSNRTHFEKGLAELNRGGKLPISIIIADCNGLKIVNDAFGHGEGDRLLVQIAGILKKVCRKDDLVARIGGDEFAIILPQTSQEQAYMVFHRIKECCAEDKSLVVAPSLAMGIATKREEAEDIHEILKKAEDRMYSAKLSENKSMRSSVLLSLRKVLEERTHETEAHASRLRILSAELGKRLGLNDAFMTELALLAHLHDIGKIAIPDSILNKTGKLTKDEWEIMKKHSEAGYRIAASSPELAFIADYILSHHERWDGTGYPERLKHYQIPLQSRIIAVVDAYDAMTNPRAYKQGHDKRRSAGRAETLRRQPV